LRRATLTRASITFRPITPLFARYVSITWASEPDLCGKLIYPVRDACPVIKHRDHRIITAGLPVSNIRNDRQCL
jgi:hypothetical protein